MAVQRKGENVELSWFTELGHEMKEQINPETKITYKLGYGNETPRSVIMKIFTKVKRSHTK
jgi:hypothetical protein